jgi:hypothetical protein
MRKLPLAFALILVACSASDRATSDAGPLHDGHMLRFDTGIDAEMPDGFIAPDTGADAESAADSGADVLAPTDTIQTDLWTWQTDAWHPSTDAGVCIGQMPCNCEREACSYNVECQACYTCWLLSCLPVPIYCATNPYWGAYNTCYHI